MVECRDEQDGSVRIEEIIQDSSQMIIYLNMHNSEFGTVTGAQISTEMVKNTDRMKPGLHDDRLIDCQAWMNLLFIFDIYS